MVDIKQALKTKPAYIFKENVQFFVVLGVNSGLEQGKKDVLQHLGKVWDQLL